MEKEKHSFLSNRRKKRRNYLKNKRKQPYLHFAARMAWIVFQVLAPSLMG